MKLLNLVSYACGAIPLLTANPVSGEKSIKATPPPKFNRNLTSMHGLTLCKPLYNCSSHLHKNKCRNRMDNLFVNKLLTPKIRPLHIDIVAEF